jgi:hypothetical protein
MENSNEKCATDFEAANVKEPEIESLSQEDPLPVIIDLSRVVDIDFTAAVVSSFLAFIVIVFVVKFYV